MRIENTNHKLSFGLKFPGFFHRDILKISEIKGQRIFAEQKISDLSTALGDEFVLSPNTFHESQNAIKSTFLSLNLTKNGIPFDDPLIQIRVKSDITRKEKRKTFYNMVMSLTSKGIKEVTENMNSAEYLPI